MKRHAFAPCVVFLLCFGAIQATAAGAEDVSPTHEEVDPIGGTDELSFQALESFCLDGDDNLLACDRKAGQVLKISPAGKLQKRWEMPFPPIRIKWAGEGEVYVGGPAVLARVNGDGEVAASIRSDNEVIPRARVSGIATTKAHVFASFGSGWSLRSRDSIVRLNRDLTEPALIAEGLRGCCQRLDLAAKDDVLYAAENARYRVLRMDKSGETLSKWGERSRTDVAGFGSCCNPMNIAFGPGGQLYTAESGLGRVKRYSPDGEFLGLVGEVGVQRFRRAGRMAASCSNITVAVSSDGTDVYVQDVKENLIRVLKKKDSD